MEVQEKLKSIAGALSICVFNRERELISNLSGKNLITGEGYNIVVEALSGCHLSPLKYVGIGTSNTPAKETDTVLSGVTFFDFQSVDYPEQGCVRFNFNLGYEDAVGMEISEYGLYTQDKRLFSRTVREPIEKTEHMTIVGMWEIRVKDGQ